MSYQAFEAVRDCSEMKGTYKAVAFAVATHADPAGRDAYAAKSTLAKESGTSDSTVDRALKAMLANGEIERTGRRQWAANKWTTIYSLAPLVSQWKEGVLGGPPIEDWGVTVEERGFTEEDRGSSLTKEGGLAEPQTVLKPSNKTVLEKKGDFSSEEKVSSLLIAKEKQQVAEEAAELAKLEGQLPTSPYPAQTEAAIAALKQSLNGSTAA